MKKLIEKLAGKPAIPSKRRIVLAFIWGTLLYWGIIPPALIIIFRRIDYYLPSLFFAGVGLIFNSVGIIFGLLPLITLFLLLYTHLVEEKVLLLKFGDDYKEYRKKSPFLFPIPIKS